MLKHSQAVDLDHNQPHVLIRHRLPAGLYAAIARVEIAANNNFTVSLTHEPGAVVTLKLGAAKDQAVGSIRVDSETNKAGRVPGTVVTLMVTSEGLEEGAEQSLTLEAAGQFCVATGSRVSVFSLDDVLPPIGQ
jgi:hypothetical protein